MTGRGSGIVCGACGVDTMSCYWHTYCCPKCGAFARGMWAREATEPKAAAAMTLEQIAEEYRRIGSPEMAERVLRRAKGPAA